MCVDDDDDGWDRGAKALILCYQHYMMDGHTKLPFNDPEALEAWLAFRDWLEATLQHILTVSRQGLDKEAAQDLLSLLVVQVRFMSSHLKAFSQSSQVAGP